MSEKNLGIVKWFGGKSYQHSDEGRTLDYGFIKVLINRQDIPLRSGEIYLHSSSIANKNKRVQEGNFVTFDIVSGNRKGKFAAANVTVIYSKNVFDELNISDAEEFKNFCQNLEDYNEYFLEDFLRTIPLKFYQYYWVREGLARIIDAEKLIMIEKVLENSGDDEICGLVNEFLKNKSTPEVIDFLRANLDADKFIKIVATCAEKNPSKLAKFIFNADEIFPTELIIKLWNYAYAENKFTAFEKYCDKFTDKEIIERVGELTRNKSVEEIVGVFHKKLDADKFIKTVTICADKNPYRWANFIFSAEEIFSTELILKLWSHASYEEKLTVFEKYFDKFTDKEISKCLDSLMYGKSTAEIVNVLRTNLDSNKFVKIVTIFAEKTLNYEWVKFIFNADEFFSTELILKLWSHAYYEERSAVFEKYFDQFNDEEIVKCVDDLTSNRLVDEVIDILRRNLDANKFVKIVTTCANKNPSKLAKFIFNADEIFSTELILKLWSHASYEEKLTVFEKYFEQFTDEEIVKCVDELTRNESVIKITDVLRKKLDADKFIKIVTTCANKNPYKWAKVIFSAEEIFSTELILKLWSHASYEEKSTAFEKYFDKFTDEEIFKFLDDLMYGKSATEIVEFIKRKRRDDWLETISRYIVNSRYKGAWATWLADNFEIFQQLNFDEELAILVMYAAAKNEKISKELIDALDAKINSAKAVRAQIVYDYFRAGYEKTLDNAAESQKYLNQAEDHFIEIFNMLADNPVGLPDLMLRDANIFPPCTGYGLSQNKIRPCFFCEAVYWNNGSYCPRLGSRNPNCARNSANLNLPAENWSLSELVKKFGLKIPSAGDKSSGEYFSRMGGEFNRVYELRERLKCSSCGEYMRSNKKFARWKDSTDIQSLLSKMATNAISHFAVFNSTVFHCENKNCDSPDTAYLSYCWHCQEIIDSRDGTPRINGWYLCPHCGAGYREENDGYAIFPATICPHCTTCVECGKNDFEIERGEYGFLLRCKSCGHTQDVSKTFRRQPYSKNKFNCEGCGEQVKINSGRMEYIRNEQIF